MALPALGHLYWAARGLGCFRDGTPCRVSGVDDCAEATFAVGEPKALYAAPWQDSVLQLTATANVTRCPGDAAGCALVLDGRPAAWMEAGVQVWDLGPLPILVEEAGGRFTDLQGNRTLATGHALATNGRVHDHLLAVLRG